MNEDTTMHMKGREWGKECPLYYSADDCVLRGEKKYKTRAILLSYRWPTCARHMGSKISTHELPHSCLIATVNQPQIVQATLRGDHLPFHFLLPGGGGDAQAWVRAGG